MLESPQPLWISNCTTTLLCWAGGVLDGDFRHRAWRVEQRGRLVAEGLVEEREHSLAEDVINARGCDGAGVLQAAEGRQQWLIGKIQMLRAADVESVAAKARE